MQDLSKTVFAKSGGPVGVLVPSSQHAGNRPSDLSATLTAPGSPSQSVSEEYGGISGEGDVIEEPPFSTSQHPDVSVTHPHDAPPSTYPNGGSRWVRAGDVTTKGMNDYG